MHYFAIQLLLIVLGEQNPPCIGGENSAFSSDQVSAIPMSVFYPDCYAHPWEEASLDVIQDLSLVTV